ncbi:hypothetical protein [Streptomyces poonensis]|uniref:Secreted protein n=1 Tax=Streptomyces poonensis TaxID=68255 RepID=A0A918PW38_9ACTN|nr:hypothetical protein [Streptomyces poonensis]GGZ22577.1 hypothetical protein GCM10010365_48520 [Streptomyces poonensis]GLJ91836.1 hypothetical protein GCM10017589_44440 [Streptomyces poonensis]
MRRITAVVLGTVTLLAATTTTASAVPDPVAAVECLTQSAGDLTTVVDPSAPGVPAEVPGVSCLAP